MTQLTRPLTVPVIALFVALSLFLGGASAQAMDTQPVRLAHDAGIPGATLESDADAIWAWPISPIPSVTRPFDLPHPYGAGHRGIDLEAAPGSEILSPDDGTVHFSGWVVDRPVLSILHPNGLISSFEPVESLVAKGDQVGRGQVVAVLVSEPSHSPGGGLHLGARDGTTYLDPLALLGAVPKAILLPLGDAANP